MADFGFKVYVTKGELATIMGAVAYGLARVGMKADGYIFAANGVPGAAIIEALDSTSGVYLDNPEVVGLFDLLLSANLIDAACRQLVADYVAEQLAIPPEISPGITAPASHRWRLPVGVDPSDWFTSDIWPEDPIGDGFLRVWSNGGCTHPEAVKEV